MSQPHEPTPGTDPAGTEQGGAGQIGGAGDTTGQTEPLPRAAGAQPPTESEPAPSAAPQPTQPYEAQPTTELGQPGQSGQPRPDAATTAATTAASGAEPPPGEAGDAGNNAMPPGGPGPYAMPPQGGPAGHYVFVPAGATVRTRRFGPGFGRFARNRATQLVAAVVVGAVIGGGTVAIVDNATQHNVPTRTVFQPGGPFNNNGGRPGGPHFGQGFGQGPSQGFRN